MTGAVQRPPKTKASIEARLKAHAASEGFDDARIVAIADFGQTPGLRLERFVELGRHGDMQWMADTLERRRHPQAMWPEARSAVVLAMSYAPPRDPLLALEARDRGVIASYAKGRDYHDVVKGRLKSVAGFVHRETAHDVKVFVDTAPLLEKPLAQASGLGWQGKHTNVVSRSYGSWLLLGIVLSAAELAADPSGIDHCGTCQRCLDICPTNAFPAPYQLDARRCISYLTIEHASHIPVEFRRPMGNRIFGCDDCLAACPWNKFARAGREARLQARPELDDPPLAELLRLDDEAFRARFSGTAIKRTGRDRFLRNVLIASGNSRDRGLVTPIENLLADASPLVRAMAVWALAQLLSADELRLAFGRHGRMDSDTHVAAEWRLALEPREAPQ